MSTSKSNVEKGPASSRKRSYLSEQKRQYLIASRPAMSNIGLMSGGLPNVATLLKGQGIEFEAVKSLQGRSPGGSPSTPAFGLARGPEILIARLNPEQGEALRLQSANGFGQLIVEHDSPLAYGAASNLKQALIGNFAAARLDRTGLKPSPVRIQVVGADDKPVPGVTVLVFGAGLPSQGVSDDDGQVELPLYTFQPGQADAVVAKPRQDYWDLVARNVELRSDAPNVIQLRTFSETLPRYNKRPFLSWGQELMMQIQAPQINGSGSVDGHGVKIAIIDSGCDNTHPSLQHITSGFDVIDGGKSTGWMQDPFSHGTHCAGIIGARPARGFSMRGFAPAAEIHVFKIFPGGRLSDLVGALDQCIEQGIDLVNLSVGTDEISFLVEQKILEATQCGIACIAATGNSGGEVQYPAKSPHVLAVAAIGRQSDFPIDSSHALTVAGAQTLDGTFSPDFTCHGPEVGVCAPGVAIISTVPGGGFDAMDGTSVAAPHVTGLAALLLAHHPAFKSGLGKQRSAFRVGILFELIKQNAAALPFLGADRTGAGLPTLAAFNADAFARLSALRTPAMPHGFFMQPNPFLNQPMGLAA